LRQIDKALCSAKKTPALAQIKNLLRPTHQHRLGSSSLYHSTLHF
jgi:hypothetical protein